MAFQQSARQTVQRVVRPASVDDDTIAFSPRPSEFERQPEESQTWVLFSPPTELTTTSYLTDSEHALETPGRSRLSDVGSLHTVARSDEPSLAFRSTSVVSAIDDQSVDDDAELDSLDGHLPGFRSGPEPYTRSRRDSQHATHVFPSHDGLGSFRLDQPILGAEAQEHIYQFERFNPRRHRRRQNSFEHTHTNLEEVYAQTQAEEKRHRIEAWRLEHSRVLLAEVQKETRRRRKSLASIHQSYHWADTESDNLTWHDQDPIQADTEQEGFLASITRTVVKDILGIDDRMLSILLGEELLDEHDDLLSSTPRVSQIANEPILAAAGEPSWQLRILERLSRELGLLVHQLSSHPGAFATYSRIQHMSLPYAGLPVIPEASDVGPATPETELDQPSQSPVPEFQPTMHRQPQPMDIPSHKQVPVDDVDMDDGDFTKEEWEKSLDIKLVFRYLVSRFTSRSGNSSTTTTSSSSHHHGGPTLQDNPAKAARVRQSHPLIARSRPVERRSFKAVVPGSPVALRHHSSCASQSTRRSARRSSCSSKHFWDIGGSLGTGGSVLASSGPMGSWGEV